MRGWRNWVREDPLTIRYFGPHTTTLMRSFRRFGFLSSAELVEQVYVDVVASEVDGWMHRLEVLTLRALDGKMLFDVAIVH